MDRKRWIEAGILCVAFLFLAAGAQASGSILKGNQKLEREEAGGSDTSVDLLLDAGELLKGYEYQLTVPAADITDQQEKEYLEQAKKEIDQSFFGNAETAEHVTEPVHLAEHYADGMVQAEWNFDRSDLVDPEGKIQSDEIPEEGALVQAEVLLQCGGEKQEYSFSFQVYPRSLTEKEQLLRDIQETLAKEGKRKGTTTFQLPQTVDGVQLKWRQKKEHLVVKVFFFEIVILLLFQLALMERRRNEEKKRKEQMELDYAEVVNKLLVLLGAGMSLKQSWNRISTQYLDKRQKKQTRKREIYDEMLITNYAVSDGESERTAYEKWGERTGLGSYQRLVRILIQNLQTGSRGLCSLLAQEAADALEERKALAKKMGEEAGTKMLLPLMMMLGIVMAIIMVPAMLSINI